ncbi:MAG TPA: hypothetical protein PLV92_15520, partial [Pirellulaceae bacterium]|nr:hypothetical protein [Pirellulaceae bacterium]
VDVAVGATGAAPLPHNVTVTVTKSGEGPAKVIVERDGKKWETTGDKLEAVPADVRVHLQSMLAPQHVRVWDFAGPNSVQARQIVVHGEGGIGGVTTVPPIPAQPLPPRANVVQVTPGVPAGIPTYAPPGVPQVHIAPSVPAVPAIPAMPGAPGVPNARGAVETYKVYVPQNVPGASGVVTRRDVHVAGGNATHDAVNQKLDRVLERLDRLAAPPAASDDVQTQLKQMRKELDLLKKKVEKR